MLYTNFWSWQSHAGSYGDFPKDCTQNEKRFLSCKAVLNGAYDIGENCIAYYKHEQWLQKITFCLKNHVGTNYRNNRKEWIGNIKMYSLPGQWAQAMNRHIRNRNFYDKWSLVLCTALTLKTAYEKLQTWEATDPSSVPITLPERKALTVNKVANSAQKSRVADMQDVNRNRYRTRFIKAYNTEVSSLEENPFKQKPGRSREVFINQTSNWCLHYITEKNMKDI